MVRERQHEQPIRVQSVNQVIGEAPERHATARVGELAADPRILHHELKCATGFGQKVGAEPARLLVIVDSDSRQLLFGKRMEINATHSSVPGPWQTPPLQVLPPRRQT